jgi:hypothetical protein
MRWCPDKLFTRKELSMKHFALNLAAGLVLATTGAAFAQDAASIDDLDADRIDQTQMEIEFEYMGSSCDQVGMAELNDAIDGVLDITFPVTRTGDNCTAMQTEQEVDQTVPVDGTVNTVNITLIGPDGVTLATGTTTVDD